MKKTKTAIVVLLVASSAMLAAMIPGGPVEARDFSGIPPLVLGAFNVFLTALGLAGFAAAFLVARGYRAGAPLSLAAAASFFAVYALDLLEIFPRSPTAMPPVLFVLETAGLLVALPLAALSAFSLREGSSGSRTAKKAAPSAGGPAATRKLPRAATAAAVVAVAAVALAIVAFATVSAMAPR